MKIVVDYSELCFLLAEVGVNAPVGVDVTHFRPPNETEKQEVLQGAEISWVIEPSDDGELIIETARPNIFHHVLAKTWDATLAN